MFPFQTQRSQEQEQASGEVRKRRADKSAGWNTNDDDEISRPCQLVHSDRNGCERKSWIPKLCRTLELRGKRERNAADLPSKGDVGRL